MRPDNHTKFLGDRDNEKCCTSSPQDCCSRASASECLRSEARRLRDKAHALEQLADQIPHLNQEADSVMFELIMKGCRP